MKHIFLLQAFGDNVISLSNITRLNNLESIKIYGTSLTENIAKNLGYNVAISKVFNDIPSFYNLRSKIFLKAIKDFYYLIKYIKLNIPLKSELFFEKKDFRFRLLKLFLNGYILNASENKENIYIDRANLLSIDTTVFKKQNQDSKKRNSILINPTGRSKKKHLSKEIMTNIIYKFKEENLKVYLIDYLGIYTEYKDEVDYYFLKTQLYEAINILKTVDSYCGPDSLFIHLAYVFDKKYFCIMNYDSSYFMPPGTMGDAHVLLDKRNFEELKFKLSNWIKRIKGRN